MLRGELTDAFVTMAPMFRVTAKNITMESKCMDSGVKVKLFAVHPAMIYYFIRFCTISSKHFFMGKQLS